MGQLAIGVDLGGTALKVGLVDADNQLLKQLGHATEADGGPQHVIDRIVGAVTALGVSVSEICGIGVGAPGSVNLERTIVSAPPNFPGWKEVDLSQSIRDGIGKDVSVVIDNDANVAALGSAHFGAGRSFDSFIMVTLGTGVGGAIIFERKLFRGTTGGAGEVGHISVDYNGPPAAAGIPGVIEGYVGQRFLSEYARQVIAQEPDSLLHELTHGDEASLNPRLLHQAAEAGDSTAIAILAWAGHKLGCGLASAVNLLDIRKVVVGGGVSAAGDYILNPARRALFDGVLPGLRGDLEIVRETLGNEAGILGAAQLAFNHARVQGVT